MDPNQIDHDQHARLRSFKQEMRGKGLVWGYDSVPQLRGLLDAHLDRTLRELHSSAQSSIAVDEARLDRLEAMVRSANTAVAVDRLGGESPLDKHFIREDMDRKACIAIAHIGPIRGNGQITVQLRNEGKHPAWDAKVSVDTGDGFPHEPTRPTFDEIAPWPASGGRPFSFTFTVGRPEVDNTGEAIVGQERIVRLRVTFRDGLASRDEAFFVLLLRNRRGEWDVAEDENRAVLSPLCRHLRPEPPPDSRPRYLGEKDHGLLTNLLRRPVDHPKNFLPVLRVHPIGDGEHLYEVLLATGATAPANEIVNPPHGRDLTPNLIQQGFLHPEGSEQFAIDDSLFRAYGLEPPDSSGS